MGDETLMCRQKGTGSIEFQTFIAIAMLMKYNSLLEQKNTHDEHSLHSHHFFFYAWLPARFGIIALNTSDNVAKASSAFAKEHFCKD